MKDKKETENLRKEDKSMRNNVPLEHKAFLTLEEAADYYNIGINKLREITNDECCKYVLWIGSKRLIKRKPLEEFLYSQYSI